jgi:hypothetical protein
MQIPEFWVSPILSIIAMLGSLILFFLTRYAGKRERENISMQVKLFRDARYKERMVDALAECHRLLREGSQLCLLVDRISLGKVPPMARHSISAQAERISENLIRYSWLCGNLDETIRTFATLYQVEFFYHPTKTKEELYPEISSLEEEIAKKIRQVLNSDKYNFEKTKSENASSDATI